MSLLNVNKVAPQSGTDFTLGDSGDTFTVPSGATLTVAGTFTQTGAQTFDGGVDIDNFNINGTTITLSSGDMTLDVAGDIVLDADGGDVFVKDAGTTFGSLTNTSGNLIIKSGTTAALTFSGANVTAAGTIGSGAITSTGIVTGTAFTAGSAVLAEAELELLDGLTAGTAIASKVVTTDASIDSTGMRNLTISGELDAATLDISGAIDIAGNSQFSGTIKVGAAATPGGTIAITTADSGATAHADADELVMENAGVAGLSILSFNNNYGNIYFGDGQDNDIGKITYLHTDNSMSFTTNTAIALKIDTSGDAIFSGNIETVDDKGILFGTGNDMYIGTNGGETELSIGKGSTTTGGTGGRLNFIPTTDGTYLDLISTEGKGPAMGLYQDDGDDNGDLWKTGQGANDGDANDVINWSWYGGGSYAVKMRINTNGNFQTAGSHSASVSFDYAEYWPWKTKLANDAKIIETYGMTVVLDGATVRLAKTGEEAKVIGVVRPNNTSTMVGGGAEINYINKYEKNVWGEIQYEEYTQCDWDETRTKDDGSTYVYHHKYMKDRIPAKRIREGAVQDPENWHTLASNLTSEDLVVPSTDAEKSAANYVERSVYKKDKGEHKKDDKLMREKINSSYDFTKSKSYIGRDKRRKEWCIVGLMGQVEIRDTAIIPTSWTKMKNLESGIDLYYIK